MGVGMIVVAPQQANDIEGCKLLGCGSWILPAQLRHRYSSVLYRLWEGPVLVVWPLCYYRCRILSRQEKDFGTDFRNHVGKNGVASRV